MPEGNDLVINRLLVEELPGPQKIAALLKARGFTLASYARSRGFWPEMLKQVLRGERPNPEVRDALATDLGLPREEIDVLLSPNDRAA
jgi:lambda repressor-like predicted transcriptional regulator